jgi:PhnB protein
MKLPTHYQPVMPYMVVKGADEFIEFLTSVFGAQELLMVRNPNGSITHAEYSVNGGTVMIADANDTWPPFPAPLYLPVENVDELYALWPSGRLSRQVGKPVVDQHS